MASRYSKSWEERYWKVCRNAWQGVGPGDLLLLEVQQELDSTFPAGSGPPRRRGRWSSRLVVLGGDDQFGLAVGIETTQR